MAENLDSAAAAKLAGALITITNCPRSEAALEAIAKDIMEYCAAVWRKLCGLCMRPASLGPHHMNN